MSIRPDQPVVKRRPDRAALIIAVALAAVGLVIIWDARHLGGAASYARIGPAIFPTIIGGFLLLLSAWTVLAAWRGDFAQREADEFPPMAWIVGGLAAQMLLLHTVGFSIATGLLFAATARGFGRGPLWKTIPIGVVFAFVVWVIFAKGLDLTLPAGPIEKLVP